MRFRFSLRFLFWLVFVVGVFCWIFLVPTDATRTEKLRRWIAEQEDDLWVFADLEVSREALTREDFFRWWIDSYVDSGYTFAAVAGDSTGGRYAIWFRPNQKGPPPLVFFGSEGDRHVVARSAWDFPQLLSYYSHYEDYGSDVDEQALAKKERDAHTRYRQMVLQRYGEIPRTDELRGDVAELEKEFEDWLRKCHEGLGLPHEQSRTGD